MSVNGVSSYTGPLSGIVHYNDSNNPIRNTNPILIKLNQESDSTDYYVTFNSKTSFNSGTAEGGNQVMIVRVGSEGKGYAESELVSKLNAGGAYTIPNFDGRSNTATVEVSSINDVTSAS
eukprot:2141362-Ditylum_brightwellii.AAC.1